MTSHEEYQRKKCEPRINRLYADLLNLGIENFMKSENFKIFLIRNNLDKIKKNLLNKNRNYTTNESDFDSYDVYEELPYTGKQTKPAILTKDFFKDLLLEICIQKENDFLRILVDLLVNYSRYNKVINTGEPAPIDINLIKLFVNDLLEFDYTVAQMKPLFLDAGYDIEKILEKQVLLSSSKNIRSLIDRDEVFIVHGHDEALLNEVAVYLSSIKIDPIILKHKANEGTGWIFDKFKKYSNVKFAIVLYTPDDIGKEKSEEEYSDRPRQNVILELGFFLGKLENKGVWILYKGFPETPSDIVGGTVQKYDAHGGWKIELNKSLASAGVRFNQS